MALAAALAGCGGGGSKTPNLGALPLVPGANVSLKVKVCDIGSSAFCAWELLVVAPKLRDSDELLRAEHRLLLSAGWSGAQGDASGEHAADSPGHKLRVTYATPTNELIGTGDEGVHRSNALQLALSHVSFAGTPALSILLEQGSG